MGLYLCALLTENSTMDDDGLSNEPITCKKPADAVEIEERGTKGAGDPTMKECRWRKSLWFVCARNLQVFLSFVRLR